MNDSLHVKRWGYLTNMEFDLKAMLQKAISARSLFKHFDQPVDNTPKGKLVKQQEDKKVDSSPNTIQEVGQPQRFKQSEQQQQPAISQQQPQVNQQQPKVQGNTKEFHATYYQPADPKQTKAGGGGTGAFGRPVVFGDVAIGDRTNLKEIKSNARKGQDTFIEIPEMKDVKTPYGMGIFRVNDVKNKRYDKTQSFDIALPESTPGFEDLKKRIGSSKMNYTFASSSPSNDS